MAMIKTPIGPVFALLLLSLCTLTYGECDQCKFTPDDAENCKVYGAIDGELIAWHRASSACLSNYPVEINSIDPSTVGCGSPQNVNSFVNGIKFETIPNSVRGGLGVSEGGFFEQQNNIYVLKDTITVNGQTVDCEASESDCYNAMKDYFAVSPGAEEMSQTCEAIVNKVANDRELEQSTVRNQLCTDVKNGVASPTECEPLSSQVADEVTANPDKDCSGFQFGPGTMDIPGCEGGSGGTTITSGALSSNEGKRCSFLLLLALIPYFHM